MAASARLAHKKPLISAANRTFHNMSGSNFASLLQTNPVSKYDYIHGSRPRNFWRYNFEAKMTETNASRTSVGALV